MCKLHNIVHHRLGISTYMYICICICMLYMYMYMCMYMYMYMRILPAVRMFRYVFCHSTLGKDQDCSQVVHGAVVDIHPEMVTVVTSHSGNPLRAVVSHSHINKVTHNF